MGPSPLRGPVRTGKLICLSRRDATWLCWVALAATLQHACTRHTHTHTTHSTHTRQRTCTRTHQPSLPRSGLWVWPTPWLSRDWPLTHKEGSSHPSPSVLGQNFPQLFGWFSGPPHTCALTGTQRTSQRGGRRVSSRVSSAQPSPRRLRRAPGAAPGRTLLTGSQVGPLPSVTSHPPGQPPPPAEPSSVSVSLGPAVSPAASRPFVTSGGVRPAPPGLCGGAASGPGLGTPSLLRPTAQGLHGRHSEPPLPATPRGARPAPAAAPRGPHAGSETHERSSSPETWVLA